MCRTSLCPPDTHGLESEESRRRLRYQSHAALNAAIESVNKIGPIELGRGSMCLYVINELPSHVIINVSYMFWVKKYSNIYYCQ